MQQTGSPHIRASLRGRLVVLWRSNTVQNVYVTDPLWRSTVSKWLVFPPRLDFGNAIKCPWVEHVWCFVFDSKIKLKFLHCNGKLVLCFAEDKIGWYNWRRLPISFSYVGSCSLPNLGPGGKTAGAHATLEASQYFSRVISCQRCLNVDRYVPSSRDNWPCMICTSPHPAPLLNNSFGRLHFMSRSALRNLLQRRRLLENFE